MRSVACAVLLGGCLIVHADEEIVDDPCPTTEPQLLADASGEFALADDVIYFIGFNGILSRVAIDGGPVYELTTERVRATALAADETNIYWASDGSIIRKPPDAPAYAIATGYLDVSHLVVDDTSVVWASSVGIDQWSKADGTVTHLDDVTRVFGLGASEGQYYFSDSDLNQVRRVPPAFVVTETRGTGPLVVDDKGVYFYETEAPFVEHSGAIRLVPRDGGALITTADRISIAIDMAEDATDLVFLAGDPNGHRINQLSRFGGEVRTLACGSASRLGMRIAIADMFVYWSDERGLYRTPKYGL